jgi:putative ABC transport system permease protein
MIFFTAAIAISTAVLAGLLPALRAMRIDLNSGLRQGGYAVAAPLGRASRILVTGQIALSCVLLICAGLMTRTILNLKNVDLGANTSNVLSGRIGLFESRYPDDLAEQKFYDSLLQNLQTIPGVKQATLTSSMPGTFTAMDYYRSDRAPEDHSRLPVAFRVTISPDYFRFFQVRLLNGRFFDLRDQKDSQKVAIVNQMLAEKSWPGENPVGHKLRLGDSEKSGEWVTVVGVVPNVQQTRAIEKLRPAVYLPLTQNEQRFISLAIRTEGDPALHSEDLRKAVEKLDPDLPVYWVRTLDDWLQINSFESRFLATLFAIFAGIAIVLTAAGQYAVLAYTIGQRTKEIGLRRALGAHDERIVRLFLNQGLKQLLIAVLIGLPVAIGFGRLLSSALDGVQSYDPALLLFVPLALLIVSLIAAFAPTKRALRINPAVALRSE